jgi:hypothetical protein
MSFDIIWQLRKTIYTVLESDNELAGMVKGIYDYVPQNTAFPYIYLGKVSINDWSTKTTNGYEVLSEINIYTNTKGSKLAFEIIGKVNQLLHNQEFRFNNDRIISTEFLEAEIEQIDEHAYHVKSKFQSLIMEQ